MSLESAISTLLRNQIIALSFQWETAAFEWNWQPVESFHMTIQFWGSQEPLKHFQNSWNFVSCSKPTGNFAMDGTRNFQRVIFLWHPTVDETNGNADLVASPEFIHYKLVSFQPLSFLVVVTAVTVIVTVSTKLADNTNTVQNAQINWAPRS